MASQGLADRVAQLEAQVTELRLEVHSSREQGAKNWRRAVEKFADDEDVQSILHEAMRLREADRNRARERPARQQAKCR
ncbi:MAG: hypothetical protein FJ291_02875 [Planctomycetes bacterium]|nr:hypothetical protein [Planctomycetota bacterium]